MDNITRKVYFENKEVYALLKKKEKLVEKIKSMQAEINKIAKDGEVLGGKVQVIKDKAIPLMLPLKKEIELGEWEVVQSFEVAGRRVSATIVDLLEEEKLRIKEHKEKELKDEDSFGSSDTKPSSL